MVRQLIEREVVTPTADETQCRRYFDNNRRRFRTPDLHEARHILIAAAPDDAGARAAAREKAAGLIAMLTLQPTLFADLAAMHSACPSAEVGGNLGQIGPGQTVPEFEAAARGHDGRRHFAKPRRVALRLSYRDPRSPDRGAGPALRDGAAAHCRLARGEGTPDRDPPIHHHACRPRCRSPASTWVWPTAAPVRRRLFNRRSRMHLGTLLARLQDDGDAATALDALGDIVLLAQVPIDGRAVRRNAGRLHSGRGEPLCRRRIRRALARARCSDGAERRSCARRTFADADVGTAPGHGVR